MPTTVSSAAAGSPVRSANQRTPTIAAIAPSTSSNIVSALTASVCPTDPPVRLTSLAVSMAYRACGIQRRGAGVGSRGSLVSEVVTATPVDPGVLEEALDALPTGVAVFDGAWSIVYVNDAGARLLGRPRPQLIDRNIWIALPELGGTILHSFLLHARSLEEQVTWRGFYPPAGSWLTATASRVGDRLHVTLRENASHRTDELPVVTADGQGAEPAEADTERLRYLAEVSEAMISTLDTGESISKLADLVVPRLCDWAAITIIGDDGVAYDGAYIHRDPERMADLVTYMEQRTRATQTDDSPMAAALLTGEPITVPHLD